MNFTNVNFLAILVCGIVHMVIGFLWYGPLFSKPWMALRGMTQADAQAGNPSPVIYLIPFLGSLIAAYVLALLINATLSASLAGGLTLGLLVGIGIYATFVGANYMFSNNKPGLFLIDAGYPVLSLAIMGIILGVWR